MKLKRRLVRLLVHLYPARWRWEFGAEFAELLMSRPLGWRSVLDVLWNSQRQQLHLGEPWLLLGCPLAVELMWNLTRGLLHGTLHETPPHSASRLSLLWPLALLTAVGFWTVVRNGKPGKGGRAAIKFAMLILWPSFVLDILLTGALSHLFSLGNMVWLFFKESLYFSAWAFLFGSFGGLLARAALRLRNPSIPT